MSSRRKEMKSMRERMEAALDNDIPDISHDVTFVVGEEKVKMSCHQFILAIASPVFETMFSQRYSIQKSSKELESEESEPANQSDENVESNCELEVRISDLHPVGLKNLIKYVYTEILNVDVKDALATMQAAHKYDIPELTEHCAKVLESNMSNENVVTSYQAAVLLNEKELEEKSWQFIELNAGAMLDSEEFIEFSEDNLCQFLKLDHMANVISEVDVFNAILKWGNRQCERKGKETTTENVREVLENAIPLIRFPLMEHNEFNDIVQPSGMLNDKECINIYKYFTNFGEKRLAVSKTMSYSLENRTGRFVFCTTAKKDTLNTVNSNHNDSFKVTGNTQNMKLKAIGIMLPLSTAQSTDITINIGLHDPSSNTWTCGTTKVANYLQICYIEFDTAVSVKTNVQYQIRVNTTNAGSGIANPVKFVQYTKDLMDTSTITWKTAAKEELTLTFVPAHYVIWALQFQY